MYDGSPNVIATPREVPVLENGTGGELLGAIVERFTCGVALVDRSHRVVMSNAAFEELFQLHSYSGRIGCCELFGCGGAGTALAGTCLSEVALAAGEPLPEVFVEPPAARRGPVWVRAAVLSPEDTHVIFQVRAARAGERPAGWPADWFQGSHLMVHTLGGLRLLTPAGPVDPEWLSQRAGQLFKFLVTERHHLVPIEVIAEAVWPHANTRTANTVRHCMQALRTHLEPVVPSATRPQFILVQNGCYRLNPDCISVDADEFERILSEGMRAFADGDSGGAISRFETAVGIYRGDYLADDRYWEWAFAERERLRELAAIPLRALAELRDDEPGAAVGYVRRLAEMEPFDEQVQRQLIRLLIKEGRRSRAVRQYQAFRVRLLRAFNEEPSFELSDLIARSS
jgi:DNA-binding SARP family transcriptional activator